MSTSYYNYHLAIATANEKTSLVTIRGVPFISDIHQLHEDTF